MNSKRTFLNIALALTIMIISAVAMMISNQNSLKKSKLFPRLEAGAAPESTQATAMNEPDNLNPSFTEAEVKQAIEAAYPEYYILDIALGNEGNQLSYEIAVIDGKADEYTIFVNAHNINQIYIQDGW